jgi:hypothetical protein
LNLFLDAVGFLGTKGTPPIQITPPRNQVKESYLKKWPLIIWHYVRIALYLPRQLPDRLTVGQQFLVLFVVVRIHLGQH